jgi:murein DD-endopeptidase MepM/ murein hydrolase activator NlpD
MAKLAYGINLNPQHPMGQPADVATLQGLQWVRLVFQRAAAHYPNLDTAFEFYDPVIDSYNAAGIGCILILNQETFWGQAPWYHGNWSLYADEFADQAGQIAAHYQGRNVAFQVWNEEDQYGPSSIFVPAADFARVLERAGAAIRAANPEVKIVLGGLSSGTESAIRYVKDVRTALGGSLPVDAIGVHPYGHWPPSGQPTIPTGWFGALEPALARYCDAFVGTPIWITEIGVSEPGGIGSEHWPSVAAYLEETFTLIQGHYASAVPVVVWFAWSDVIRGAGLVDVNGNPKQPIYDRFFQVVRAPFAEELLAVTPPATDLTPTDFLLVREGPGTNYDIITTVGPGDRLRVVEAWETAWAKLGKTGEWINLQPPGFGPGWSAAWYLKLAIDIPSEAPALVTPTDDALRVREGPGLGFAIVENVDSGDLLAVLENWPGAVAKLGYAGHWINVRTPSGREGWAAAWFLRLPTAQELAAYGGPQPPLGSTTYPDADLIRALAFDRDPNFDRLPACDPTQITSFSGFGPNNYSYHTYASGDDYYHNLSGLHNGLDFGMPRGTPLCAMDWGVVMHVSRREDDNPYGAGPYSVILRHGGYVVLYGHLLGKEQGEHVFVSVGDIVAPGQAIGLSGTANAYHHLHFEVRKIRQAYINQLRAQAQAHTPEPLDRLRHMQAHFHLRGWAPTRDYYINPVSFFEPSLVTYWGAYAWPHACLVDEDMNRNGYPDRVVCAGELSPRDYDLHSLRDFGPGDPHFWQGSRRV